MSCHVVHSYYWAPSATNNASIKLWLQNILKDIIQNRIVCLQRNLSGMIPNRRYDLAALSSEEANLMVKIINHFYSSNPPKNVTISHHFDSTIKKEKILWYLNLPKFLAECKQRKDIQEKFNQTKGGL